MSDTRESPRLRTTKDYSMFVQSANNRPVDLDSRRKLLDSMQSYGFLPAYPLHVHRMKGEKLEIQDGQHRFAVAQKLGIAVWYVVLNEEINIAQINGTQKAWTPLNFAQCFANQGKKDYAELLEFSRQYELPIRLAASLLTMSFGESIRRSFFDGSFKIKSREKAGMVASIYAHMGNINRRVKSARLIEAIYAVSWVPNFEPERLKDGASRCPEKLIAYSTRDAYLTLLEDLYNFGRKYRQPLKIPAENAMRERNPTVRKFQLAQNDAA